MRIEELRSNMILRGSAFPEPVEVSQVIPMGSSVKLIGKGLNTNSFYDPILNEHQIAAFDASPLEEPFDGDATKFRVGIEALRLGMAYEYDPYFTLSIARVDPLPHQLEAVYDYFLKLPRIRFLLADDPGAGKTIMAGLLIKELKIRGLIKRILIVTPANLSFQWQREMNDKFRERFDIMKGDVLRTTYGVNPWQDKHQVITSISWVSRIQDANESLLRSHWDLIIVDEAHKMSAYSADKTTLAYDLGRNLSEMTDHYLLMTATPHKGDKENFRLFLALLDKDVYGDISSLDEALNRHEAPFYLRRIKEALITFPDPETGLVKAIFTKRNVDTVEFELNQDEWELYDELTKYVEDQSIKAAQDNSARGRALGFTMAMLQRRFASSVRAVRLSLERMKAKREQILADPEGYRQEQMNKKMPEDFDDLSDEEQQEILDELENVVASINPEDLRAEIQQISKLILHALELEKKEVESKLVKLKEVLITRGIFQDPKMKLLIFTEHKDTLNYLVEKLESWKLGVTKIHGGLKIGDRDTPNTRIYAEREFKESKQVLVATEAAGEGINLQFCWFMINYDIPWNPVRLEQRMGRIHRYGQEKDCLIFNFVSTSTREGRVLQKLFERIKQIEMDIDPNRTGKIFNVLGDIFPSNNLEQMLRAMYARNISEDVIKERIIEQVDTDRLRRITSSTLEGLAKKELNLSSIVGKSAEARERRLVPEVIEDFFVHAGTLTGVSPKEVKKESHVYRIGRIPNALLETGEKLEPRFGKLGRDYKHITFDKKLLTDDPTLDWVTPGHPLFEAVRDNVLSLVQDDLSHGAVFYNINSESPVRLDVFSSAVKDGSGAILHQRLFVTETDKNGNLAVRQPTIFLDLIPAPKGTSAPKSASRFDRAVVEHLLYEKALQPFLNEVRAEREREIATIRRHLEFSLNALIHKQNMRMAELHEQSQSASDNPLLAANMKQTEDRIDELNRRKDRRTAELDREGNLSIGNMTYLGCAWVLPHPERAKPEMANIVRDDEIERIAVETVMAHERERGWQVVSVEKENRGFDLISRRLHQADPQTAVEVRFIEVKGRAGIGEVALTSNEYRTAERLQKDYWLYVVFNCASKPELHAIQNPARLGWQPLVKIEHYHVEAKIILEAAR